MTKNFQDINSEFLLNLLLEENRHLKIVDFIDKQYGSFACICISLALVEKYQEIQTDFVNGNIFVEKYFVIYANALEKNRMIVGDQVRQIFFDEGLKMFPLDLINNTIKKISTDISSKNDATNLLHKIRDKHSYALILRDEIMFVVIHYNGDEYIIIDPHVEYCGIITENQIFRYMTYDNIWDSDVHMFIPNEISPTVPTLQNSNSNSNNSISSNSSTVEITTQDNNVLCQSNIN